MSNHQQFTTTLKQMTGRILAAKPNLPPTLAANFINDCIRLALDRRTQWAGLVEHTSLYVPPLIDTGTIDLTQNSDSITISGTTWPVADWVNTTAAAAIGRPGLQTVVPASMDNITVDTLLYVDASGTPEIVAVKSVTSTSFLAEFRYAHTANYTLTCSSYANRQLKFGATYPIYNIQAVTSTTTAKIDLKWLAADASLGYKLMKIYYTIDPSVKSLISIIDQTQGIPPLRINLPVTYLDRTDPQRTALGYPQVFAAKFKDTNGNMRYELWPAPQSARQLTATYSIQPAALVNDNDFLPDFLSPTVIYYYCMAQAWMTRISTDDVYWDPGVAKNYQMQFESAFNDAWKADDEKMNSGVQWNYSMSGIGGADYARSHSLDAIYGPW